MAVSSRATYLAEVRQAVTQALCLMDYPSPHVEGHNKPIVEVEGLGHALIAAPIVLSRGPSEGCLVEHSINSSRISLRFKAQDEMERCIIDTHLKYLMHRAEDLGIVRKIPVAGYDMTFLITHAHLTFLPPSRLCGLLVMFLEKFGIEVKAAKLALKAQSRGSVDDFWGVMHDLPAQN